MASCRESELLAKKKELVNDHIVYLVLKRLMDIVGASVGLLLASPIMLIVAILIKLEDPKGPTFFSQVRNGAYPKTFKMYKFRSMYIDAEERLQELMHLNEQSGPAFKIKDDPRITKIGKFIRKTSLDELPQLFNVLRGDMSLVGPRPLLVEYLPLYSKEQMKRHNVRPGITGYAQVNGRNNISWTKKFELDVYYVENFSLWLDVKILFQTVAKVLGQADINQEGNVTMEKFNGMN